MNARMAVILACALLVHAGAPLALAAASVDVEIAWVDGKPHGRVTLHDGPAKDAAPPIAAWTLVDAKGTQLAQAETKLAPAAGQDWVADVPLDKIQDPKKTHRWEVSLHAAALELDFGGRLTIQGEQAAVPWYGITHQGNWPRRSIVFLASLPGFKNVPPRDIPVEIVVRDGDDGVVLQRVVQLSPGETRQVHQIELAPDTSTSVGPYQAEITIDSDAHALTFRASEKFAQPCAEIPLTGFEHGDPTMWFAAEGQPQNYLTAHYYYSQHLTDLVERDYPRLTYDSEHKHSGRQALRIGYEQGREAYAWSRQELPGKPSALSLWVHGNESQDELVIRFEDHINFAQPGYARNPNFSQATICKLDFAGWRRFLVPVLGDGLQVSGIKGSTVEIDAPVKIMALVVKSARPAPPPKPQDPAAKPADPPPPEQRQIWVDDVSVQTQVAEGGRLSLELQGSPSDGLLTAEAQLFASVGNGRGIDLARGKLSLSARDAEGQAVWTQSLELPVKAGEYGTIEVPLRDLAARGAAGPIDIDATFADASVAGARITRRFTWKLPRQAGLVFDFEQPEIYSGYQLPTATKPAAITASRARVVDGGAEGSAHSLALQVDPQQADNSVLLHPALPGIVEHVEVFIRGGDRPVVLQPWFIDSGRTGVQGRTYNLFWARPITVDWPDWRKVSIPTPPIPPGYADKSRTFLFEPCHPLNLAFSAKTEGEQPVEIRFDQVKVVTHLARDDWHQLQLEYPDATRMHAPGAPLAAMVTNFAAEPATFELSCSLQQAQGHVAYAKKLPLTVPAGARQRVLLMEHLPAGVYELELSGIGRDAQHLPIAALDTTRYFGPQPLATLIDPLRLRRSLGLLTERIYLDWDNVEPAPYLRHWYWFDQDARKKRDIPILPEALHPLAARQLAATQEVTAGEQELRKAQGAINPATQTEKQAAQRVAAAQAAIDQPKQAVETARKAAADASAKATAAATAHSESQLAHAEATKNVAQATQQLKQANDQLNQLTKQAGEAEKRRQDAEKALGATRAPLAEAEKAAAATQAALTAAEKEKAAAEAARDAAQAAADELGKSSDATEEQKKAAERKVAEAKAKLAEGQNKFDATTKAATGARERRTAAQQALDTAQARLTAAAEAVTALQQTVAQAKSSLETATTQANASQQALVAAKKSLDERQKAAQQTKAEQDKAQNAQRQAENKLDGLEKALAREQQNLADRQKTLQEAQATLEQTANSLIRGRAELARLTDELDAAKAPLALHLDPVVGFSAEWAGPEAREPIAKGTYIRWIPNLLQVPERLVDWSLFVREVMREYGTRFDRWVFWENPDLDRAPQSIPPDRYRSLLEAFHRWVKLYNPRAKVIAGGFNFDKSLEYLARIPQPDTLPLDEIAVQMNLGELSPEQADLEGYLDDLDALLKLRAQGRSVSITELDWPIGSYVSPVQQAAYHARAAIILNSRGAAPHQFQLVNTGFELGNFGVFYRLAYGNTADLQTFKPWYAPKPSYFALIEANRFLADWKFVSAVPLSGRSLDDQRAFVYRHADGRLAVAMWRTVAGTRTYRMPADWKGAGVRDIFDVPVDVAAGLRLGALPFIVYPSAGHSLDSLVDQLRHLEASDDSYPVALDLQLSENDNRQRAHYQASGQTHTVAHGGQLAGGRKLHEGFVDGLEQEQFTFTLRKGGHALLMRRWYFAGGGQTLAIALNGGAEQAWNLGPGQDNSPGVRESTFVLRNCQAGENRVVIRYRQPGNASGYRIEPLAGDSVSLTRCGAINTRQSRGRFLNYTNVAGGPLTIGKTAFEDGIGAHATSFIEYPLNRQFASFEVTVGIDGSTEGRGSVVFRVFVDGQAKADSGVLNGFSPAKTLKIEKLDNAERLILSVTDAGDGDRHDLANWVGGKLVLKAAEK